jgi:hypothetical protein
MGSFLRFAAQTLCRHGQGRPKIATGESAQSIAVRNFKNINRFLARIILPTLTGLPLKGYGQALY